MSEGSRLHAQREHDRARRVEQTMSYFIDDSGKLQSIELGQERSSRLRSLRNDRTKSLEEVGLPDEARLGRVDRTLVNTNDPSKVEVVFVGGIHADESQSPSEWELSTSLEGPMSTMPRAEIMEAHDVAAMIGRRDSLIPLSEEDLVNLPLKDVFLLVILPRGGTMVNNEKLLGLDVVANAWSEEERQLFKKQMDTLKDENGNPIDYSRELRLQNEIVEIGRLMAQGDSDSEAEAQTRFDAIKSQLAEINSNSSLFTLAKKINLNRQFPVTEQMRSIEDLDRVMTYSEAQLMLQATVDMPNVKYIFTMHEDPEFTKDNGQDDELHSDEGFYFYDAHYTHDNDPDRELVVRLKNELADELLRNNFFILSGIDDPNDPDLGFYADRGYIDQPIIDKDGQVTGIDGTYESGMVALGQKGLLKVERAFCFEIPGGIAPERKKLLLRILQEKFIVPFLQAKGVG